MNNYRCRDGSQSRQGRHERCDSAGGSTASPGALPQDPVVAMAYVPFQQDSEVYSLEQALQRGTAFPALYKPFLAGCLK